MSQKGSFLANREKIKLFSTNNVLNPGKINANDHAAIAATGNKTNPNLSLFLKKRATNFEVC